MLSLKELPARLRRAGVSVFLATDEAPARHISALLNEAADELERHERALDDELRAVGNAVIPDMAAAAWTHLWREFKR